MPATYVRSFSFAGFQANQPARPLPGTRVDIEFDAVAAALAAQAALIDAQAALIDSLTDRVAALEAAA